jgi:hypothetical protein
MKTSQHCIAAPLYHLTVVSLAQRAASSFFVSQFDSINIIWLSRQKTGVGCSQLIHV